MAPPPKPDPDDAARTASSRSGTSVDEMMPLHIARFDPFDPVKESWESYFDRWDVWCRCSRIVSDADKSLHLCNNLGAKVFGELRLRTAPTRPADVDYKVLTDMLRERYGSTHSEIREHQVFRTVRQGAGQSIREYSAALRNQAGKCSFTDVDVQLRDQFIMGLARDELRQRILAEPHTTTKPLTYDRVLTLALNQEVATKAQAPATSASIQFVGDKNKFSKPKPMWKTNKPTGASSSSETCSRCGGRHPSKDCRRVSPTDECRKCGKRGHFAQVCRQGQQQAQLPQRQHQLQKRARANYLDDQASTNILFHNTHEQARDRGWMENVRVEGKVVTMLIDTGATHTVISEKTWRKHLQTPLVPSTRIVRAYGGRTVAIKGECDVTVKTKKFEGRLRALITPGDNVNLMGRDWLERLMPELADKWMRRNSTTSLNTIDTPAKAIDVLQKTYPSVFQPGLGHYEYDIEYRATDKHGNVDALSRLPIGDDPILENNPQLEGQVCAIIEQEQLDQLPIDAKQIAQETTKDSELLEVLEFVKTGWPEHLRDQGGEIPTYFRRRHELTSRHGCLMWGLRVVIPKKFRRALLEQLHEQHLGMARMKSMARMLFFWPGLDQDIEDLARRCDVCAAAGPEIQKVPLRQWESSTTPWQRLHIDFAGPFQNAMWLIVVDSYSCWPEVVRMSTTTTSDTIDALKKVFATHGLPLAIVSDNGPQFVSDEFERYCAYAGIRHIRTAPYHPQSNGLAERFVRTFKEGVRKMMSTDSGLSLTNAVGQFLLAYRITPHTTTGVPPSERLMGRQLRTRWDLLRPTLPTSGKEEMQRERQRTQFNKQAKDRPRFDVGTLVFARNLRPGERWLPGVVKKSIGRCMYEVQMSDAVWRRHANQLKQRYDVRVPSESQSTEQHEQNDQALASSMRSPKRLVAAQPEQVRQGRFQTPPEEPMLSRRGQRDRRPPPRFSP
jgi:transposase InsO family protein/predicted aspartyl protease